MNKLYNIVLKADYGSVTVQVYTSSEDKAKKIALESQNAPEEAIEEVYSYNI